MRQMLRLRYEMLRKPLGLSFDQEELEKEKDDVLMGAFEDDRILGCCLLTPDRCQNPPPPADGRAQ